MGTTLRLVTAVEMAKELNVQPATIVKWGLEGFIPRCKVSHKVVRYDPDKVLSALAQKGQAPRKLTVLGGETSQ
jgi:hypothetical protein